MFWTEDVAAKCSGPQIINDSKTPSGRVHVGALRGVLIHDAIFRTLREKGIEARYLFGVDDYDPLDEIPAGKDAHFEKYLGQPLCNVPPPDHSPATDMAEHYIKEFFEIFDELGVKVEKYRMRDVYQSGRFNQAIDTILQSAATVRRVYKEVSNSDRPETWFPFQTICEKCGRIGTTEVFAYDDGLVSYRCRPDMVKWARGCGHEGRVSPFDGRGKLPWKLEWVAKWVTFPVTIEGAGKDHSTKGGSRDVSAACLRAIFGKEPPLNVPYEFFLVGGAKMSSSRGVGAAARNIADLLPPEALRFLMIRTKPNSPVNFDVKEEGIIKLYNEFDRFHSRAVLEKNATPDEACVYRLSELTPEGGYDNFNFQVVSALVQMPHLDVVEQITKRKGAPLTEIERRHLDQRIASAKVWVEQYASEEEKTRLQETLPAHCGDSRLYLVRDGQLITRTRDHSYLEQQKAGLIRMESINRNVLFTCLGSPSKPVFDVVGPVTLQQGDRLMLCSDGLWSSLSDDEIVNHLATRSIPDAVPELVEHALRNAGEKSDNVTVLAMEWETPDPFESTHGISTDEMNDGVFASTIQAGLFEATVEDMDDAAIERSIAEINEAIKRSANKRR